MEVLAGGTAEREDVVACSDFVSFPDGVAEFEVKGRPVCLLSNDGEVVLFQMKSRRPSFSRPMRGLVIVP